jgi:hypothetical protein
MKKYAVAAILIAAFATPALADSFTSPMTVSDAR